MLSILFSVNLFLTKKKYVKEGRGLSDNIDIYMIHMLYMENRIKPMFI